MYPAISVSFALKNSIRMTQALNLMLSTLQRWLNVCHMRQYNFAVLSPWIVPNQYFTQGSITSFLFSSLLLALSGFPLVSQHQTGYKLNASAEKHASGSDLAALAARVMNSANCAYHKLLLLVLIATVTTHLERRWAHHRQAIFICGLFLCHSKGSSIWRIYGGLLEQNVRTRQTTTDIRAIWYYTFSISQKQIKNFNQMMFTFKLFIGFYIEWWGCKDSKYTSFVQNPYTLCILHVIFHCNLIAVL